MKRVTGYISCRPIGCYEFEYMLPDNMSQEEIEEYIREKNELCMNFDVEDGYEEVTETITKFVKR